MQSHSSKKCKKRRRDFAHFIISAVCLGMRQIEIAIQLEIERERVNSVPTERPGDKKPEGICFGVNALANLCCESFHPYRNIFAPADAFHPAGPLNRQLIVEMLTH